MQVRRSCISIEDVTLWHNLLGAVALAIRGKRDRPEVGSFMRQLDAHLAALSCELRAGNYRPAPLTEFTIHDPKTRRIRAPILRDRVVHHALMAKIGPVLDRALIDDTFACRVGKGTLAAVERVERLLRRFPWYAKLDVKAYFPSIDHSRLCAQLGRRFRDRGVLDVCAVIIDAYADAPGRGVPIGALTSQHFANHYLGPLDRFLMEAVRVGGMVRYMDDIVVFVDSRKACHEVVADTREFARTLLGLELHRIQMQRSRFGVSFLGYRLDGQTRRPTLRRRRRFRAAIERWERAFRLGLIDASTLQRGTDAALAIVQDCQSARFRRRFLASRAVLDA